MSGGDADGIRATGGQVDGEWQVLVKIDFITKCTFSLVIYWSELLNSRLRPSQFLLRYMLWLILYMRLDNRLFELYIKLIVNKFYLIYMQDQLFRINWLSRKYIFIGIKHAILNYLFYFNAFADTPTIWFVFVHCKTWRWLWLMGRLTGVRNVRISSPSLSSCWGRRNQNLYLAPVTATSTNMLRCITVYQSPALCKIFS